MKLPGKQKELFMKIDEILWKDWDPIGVNDNENVRDEYQSYTPHVFKLVIEGADKVKIASHLYHIETVNIGLGGDKARCEKIAQIILDTKS